MYKRALFLSLAFMILTQTLFACAAQPQNTIQPTPTLGEPLSQRDAIRHIRSHVIAQVQIVDPFQVAVAQAEGVGDVYAVSYLSPNPFGGELFNEEQKNVVLQATEGFVRSETKLPYLFVSATSVDQQAGNRTLSIDYESAYQWFTGQIDDAAYVATWIVVQ